MDSSTSPPPPPPAQLALALAQGMRSYRKPSLAAATAASASKPRKPHAGGSTSSKHSTKILHSTSKLSLSPWSKAAHNEIKADTDKVHLQQNGQDDRYVNSEGNISKKGTEAVIAEAASSPDSTLAVEVAEASRENKTAFVGDEYLAEDEANTVERCKQEITDCGAPIIEKITSTEEASHKEGEEIYVSPQKNMQDSAKANNFKEQNSCQGPNWNAFAREENHESGSCADIPIKEAHGQQIPDLNKNSLKQNVTKGGNIQTLLPEGECISKDFADLSTTVPIEQGSMSTSPLTETKTVVYVSEEEAITSALDCLNDSNRLKNEGEIDIQQNENSLIFTEHLDSEQEGFLFSKGKALVKESVRTSESLPAGDVTTEKQFKEQNLTSLSQFQAALIAAADLNVTASTASLDVDSTSSMPSSDLMEAAVVALAKDILATKLTTLEHDKKKCFLYMPWKLPLRALLTPSVVISALGVLLWRFVLAVIQDDMQYLHPT